MAEAANGRPRSFSGAVSRCSPGRAPLPHRQPPPARPATLSELRCRNNPPPGLVKVTAGGLRVARHARSWGGHLSREPMFGHLRARWRETRGTQLKRQFENASLYVRDLGDEQAERFDRGMNYLFDDWVERFGPVKDCEVRIRKHTVSADPHPRQSASSRTPTQCVKILTQPTFSHRLVWGSPCQALSHLIVLLWSRRVLIDPRGARCRARLSRRNLVFGWVHVGPGP